MHHPVFHEFQIVLFCPINLSAHFSNPNACQYIFRIHIYIHNANCTKQHNTRNYTIRSYNTDTSWMMLFWFELRMVENKILLFISIFRIHRYCRSTFCVFRFFFSFQYCDQIDLFEWTNFGVRGIWLFTQYKYNTIQYACISSSFLAFVLYLLPHYSRFRLLEIWRLFAIIREECMHYLSSDWSGVIIFCIIPYYYLLDMYISVHCIFATLFSNPSDMC